MEIRSWSRSDGVLFSAVIITCQTGPLDIFHLFITLHHPEITRGPTLVQSSNFSAGVVVCQGAPTAAALFGQTVSDERGFLLKNYSTQIVDMLILFTISKSSLYGYSVWYFFVVCLV